MLFATYPTKFSVEAVPVVMVVDVSGLVQERKRHAPLQRRGRIREVSRSYPPAAGAHCDGECGTAAARARMRRGEHGFAPHRRLEKFLPRRCEIPSHLLLVVGRNSGSEHQDYRWRLAVHETSAPPQRNGRTCQRKQSSLRGR
jgi:hypothetical protein